MALIWHAEVGKHPNTVTGYLHCLGQDVRVPADDTFKNIPLNKKYVSFDEM